MLKDIIEAQVKIAGGKFEDEDGAMRVDKWDSTYFDQVITQTAQIVAREVIRKVREGVPEENTTMYGYESGREKQRIHNNLRKDVLTHLQSLENELEKSDETIPDIPGFEGTRENLDKLSIN